LSRSGTSAASLSAVARRQGRLYFLLQILPLLVLFGAFLVVPYLNLLQTSFYRYDRISFVKAVFTLENYGKIFFDVFYFRILMWTIGIGIIVTLLTLLLGYPVAWRIARARPAMRSLLLAVVLSPLLVNLVVRTYAWQVLLAETGIVNTWLRNFGLISAPLPLSRNLFGVVLGLTQIALPFMVLSLISVISGIRDEIFEAAESLGSSPTRTFFEVLWPLTLPGVSAGCVLVFCYCTSSFITPQVLGGGRVATISTLIYQQFSFALNYPFGSALVFVLLAINLAVIALQNRLFRTRSTAQ